MDDDVRDATPPGWYVGRPSYRDDLEAWEQYAYVPAESRRGVAHRAHEWTAMGQRGRGGRDGAVPRLIGEGRRSE